MQPRPQFFRDFSARLFVCAESKHQALPTSEFSNENVSKVRLDAEIILPTVHVISYAKWSKGWFQGSSEWKLEGLVKEKDVKKLVPRSQFDHRYVLNINKSDLSFKTYLTVERPGIGEVTIFKPLDRVNVDDFPMGGAVSADGDVCRYYI